MKILNVACALPVCEHRHDINYVSMYVLLTLSDVDDAIGAIFHHDGLPVPRPLLIHLLRLLVPELRRVLVGIRGHLPVCVGVGL